MGIYYKGEEVGFIVNSPASGTLEITENGEYDVRDKAKVDVNVPDWQPNPTWWDIEKILAEDTRDYKYKTIILLMATDIVEETLDFTHNTFSAYATSDGAFYEGNNITHTWDLTKDKPCLVDGKEEYKTRYVIAYSQYGSYIDARNRSAIYIISNAGLYPEGLKYNPFLEAIKVSGEAPTNSVSYALDQDCALKYIQINTDNVTGFNSLFSNNCRLKTPPTINVSSGKEFSSIFRECSSLDKPVDYNTMLGENFNSAFYGCVLVPSIKLNTTNGKDLSNMCYNCQSLKKLEIDIRNATNVTNLLTNCKSIIDLKISNIKKSLQIGSGTSWGKYLKPESLLYTIKELHDNSSGTSTLTLYVGSVNLTKLADVYVKLIDITDEMRAEDEYIDNKKPFEVCENTDEGAMTITEYVTSKNWQLA